VKIWTFKTFEAALPLLTRKSFIHEGVELLFFPPMRVRTLLEALTSFFVAGDEGATLPILAKLDLIQVKVWSSSKVLVVVCV
jgi:hypothetical protein